MASHTSTRPEPTRSATWPADKMQQPSQASNTASPDTQAFNDDLEQHPERHFLSPMTAEDCYGWDSDDSDDDDDGEWNARITDFSLFSADRKRAIETGQPLDGKWDDFVSNQTEAFERSVARVREQERSEDVPALTPDLSPDLRDDLEDGDEGEMDRRRMVMPQIQVPNYLTVEVKPGAGQIVLGPDDDLPLTLAAFARERRVQRPGLRHARTLSGKRHAWRRPGEDMFTVGEDVYGEEEAEKEDQEEMGLMATTGAPGLGGQ